MKAYSRFAASLVLPLVLGSCAVTVITADGPYLQLGPADALLGEISMPDTDFCRQAITQFQVFSRTSKCVANSANLPYLVKVRNDFWDVTLPVSARTATACEDWQKRLGKAQGWRVMEPCKRVSSAAQ